MMNKLNRVRRWEATACLAALVALAAAPSSAGVVTGVVGEVMRGETEIRLHDEVPPGEIVELGLGGRCALLLSSNATAQLCDEARIRLPDARRDRASLELLDGSIKATLEGGGEALEFEVRTPASLVVARGGVVHIEVERGSGDTTISSLESEVFVAPAATLEGDAPATRLGPGQQVVVRFGELPGKVHRFDASVLRSSKRCLDDSAFRQTALGTARGRDRLATLDAIAMADVPDQIDVASSPAAMFGPLHAGAPATNVNLCVTTPSACFQVDDIVPPVPEPPRMCMPGEIPGPQCI